MLTHIDIADGERLEPFGDRVLVEVEPNETQTEAGILIPGTAQTRQRRATVIRVGPGLVNAATGRLAEPRVRAGDHVLIFMGRGNMIRCGNRECVVLGESDIMGVIAAEKDKAG